jgi:ACS family hexuronate transporter-like MFS transporter
MRSIGRAEAAGEAGTALAERDWYPWLVLVAATLVQTSASFGNQAISPLAPFLVDALGLTHGQVGLIATLTYLGGCLVLVVAGRVSDRFGVRRLFLLGPLGAGLALALAGVLPGYVGLLLGMTLYGVGNGFALPPTTRAIVEWFPTSRRGLPMGIKQVGVALAGLICGLVVPPLAGRFGWQPALGVLGVAVLVSGLAAWATYRDRAVAHAGDAATRQGLWAVARERNLLLLGGMTFLFAGVQLSVVGFLVLFLRERVGLGVAEAGGLLALAQGGGVAGRIGWGLVSDHFLGGRRRPVLAVIGVLAAAAALGLAAVGPQTPRLVLVPLLLTFGLSAIGWNGISMTFVAEVVGPQVSATAAGLNLTASYLGIMVCPPLFGLLVDLSGSYALAFAVGAGWSLAALGLLAAVRPRPLMAPG